MRSQWIGAFLLFLCPALSYAADGEKRTEAQEALRIKADDLLAMMEVYAEAKRWPAAIAKGREAHRAYLALGLWKEAGRAQTRVGGLCLTARRLNEARWELDAALDLQKKIRDPVGACLTLTVRVDLALMNPDPSEAVPHLLQGFDIVRKHGLRGSFVLLAAAASRVRTRLRLIEPAGAVYLDLLDKEAEFKIAMGWSCLGEQLYFEKIQVLQRDKRYDDADKEARRLITFYEKRKYLYGVAFGHHYLGLIHTSEEKLEDKNVVKAEGAYLEAARLRGEIGDRVNLGWSLNNLGFLYLLQGRHTEAKRQLEQALALFREYSVLPGERGALLNLMKLGRDAKLREVEKAACEGLAKIARKKAPEPQELTFSPEKIYLSYYIFMREEDHLPVVKVLGGKMDLSFTVLSTGDVFRVPVDPRTKEVVIEFKAPVSVFLAEPPVVAKCVFRVAGGRGVAFGNSYLFFAEGITGFADREGKLSLQEGEPEAGPKWTFDPEAEEYGSGATPVLALRTAIEAFNRGDWEVFLEGITRFARRTMNRESFLNTHGMLKDNPVGISISEGKMRNPVWAEIRYSYRALKKADVGKIKAMYGKNRYRAYLVLEGDRWRLDYLHKD
ncbi:MAG: tetratricopeptide repeat protein [Planctomycetota bacterium]